MRIIGLAGWSGSGKTTLLTKVIPRLIARGLAGLDAQARASRLRPRPAGQGFPQHRTAGATEVLIGSAKRWALMHELRGEPERDAAGRCWRSCRRSIWCWSKASSASAIPKLEVHRAAIGKPLLHPDDPHIVAIASDAPLPQAACRWSISTTSRRIADILLEHAAPLDAAAARMRSALMAQLTDDCFAFSGPLLPVDDMERLIARARARRSPRPRPSRSRAARGRVLAADVVAPIDLPPFDNSAVDGYAVRHADLDAEAETRLAIVGRVTAGRARRAPLGAGRGDPHLHRRADAGRRRHRVHAGGRARRRRRRDRAAGPQARRQPAARRRGRARRARSCCRPGRRLAAQDVALAAAVGLTRLDGAPPRARRAVLDRRRDRRAGRAAAGRRALRRQPLSARRACWSGSAPTSTDLGILPDDPDALARAIARGRARPRSGADLRRRLDRRGRSRARRGRDGRHGWCSGASPSSRAGRWRWAWCPARAGSGAAFVGLPGNPVAAFVTFVRVVRPLLLRLAGAQRRAADRAAGAAGVRLPEEDGRREYVRVALRARRRRHDRGGQASAGGRRRHHVADRDRRAGRACRRRRRRSSRARPSDSCPTRR